MPWDEEPDRASALAELDILDSSGEQIFDDIVQIAAQACDAPIALISLLDQDRQWFKAKVGLDARQTPIEQSVCMIGIDDASFLEIQDLSRDARTSGNPLVTGERAFRFYAGAPLVLRSGAVIGRLCVIDVVPRAGGLHEAERGLLQALARQVSDHLDLRRIARISERMAVLQAALREIAEVIRGGRTVSGMARGVVTVVGRALDADRASLGMVDGTVETIDIEAEWTAPGVTSQAGRHRFEDFGSIRAELIQGEPLVIEDAGSDPRTASDPAPLLDVGVRSLINMPVRERGRTSAVLIVNSGRRRGWTEEELWFLRSVADRLEIGLARHGSDRQQQVLTREIDRRVDDMLALVQAVTDRTAAAPTPDRASAATRERRYQELAAARGLLLRKSSVPAG